MRRILRLFEKGSVSISGMRGTGKDMLMANVVARRKLPYISNMDYGGERIPFEPSMLDCKNSWRNFMESAVKHFEWPYGDGLDIYFSDGNVYMPSQYQGELVKEYGHIPIFMALYRQLADGEFHYNCQNLNRMWDKVRELSDCYIRCTNCFTLQKACKRVWRRVWRKLPTRLRDRMNPLYGFPWVRSRLVVQKVILYERYESAVNRVPPFALRRPLLNPNRLQLWEIQKQNYLVQHGVVKPMTLIYFNKSKYNTRLFKEMLENA